MGFGKKGKFSPRYIELYQMLRRIGNVASDLDLLVSLALNYPVFHMSMLKKYMGDPFLIVLVEGVEVKYSLSYEKVLLEILDRQVHRLRTKDIALVNVLWRNKKVEESTWELEEDMKAKYPFLFPMFDVSS